MFAREAGRILDIRWGEFNCCHPEGMALHRPK
jgi:hypothetical protein